MADDETHSRVEARRGFFPVVIGDQVSVTQAGAQLFIAQGDLSISQGGGRVMVSGRDASISQGGAGIAVAQRLHAERSYIGLALGKNIELTDDSRLILGSSQAAVLGIVAGVACAMVTRLLAIRSRKRRQ